MGDQEGERPSASAAAALSEGFQRKFAALTAGYGPFRWQERLYRAWLEKGRVPAAIDLPTGLGKTSVMVLWYLARKAGAKLPRRLVYVVDRRAVVDQATSEAEKIKKNVGDDALRISTLRGQYADNREWLENPAAEAIIVGTVDMIGSRLLFEGYGASRRMRPYMAGLLGTDTLVVLDESHLVPPFEKLLEQIQKGDSLRAKDEADGAVIPPFRLLPLSATGGEKKGDVFELKPEDWEDPPVKDRLKATKRLRFEALESKDLSDADVKKKLFEELATAAWELCDEGTSPARILVYCNSRDVAGKVKDALDKKVKGEKIDIEPELFVGARRVKEREDAKKELDKLGFFSGGQRPDKAAFVIATSAGEVGVDLDADHMVMDLVPFERMVQRLGRVNRLGKKDSQVVVIRGERPEPKKKDAPTEAEKRELIAWETGKLLGKLPKHDDGSHDASPGKLLKLKEGHGEAIEAATSPDPLYPALTRPLVDAWSMTSLTEHTGRPEVGPWLRGWVEEEPQTTLVWRTHLPVRMKGGPASDQEVNDFFAAARPHLTEKLEAATWQMHDWLKKRIKELLKAADKRETTDDEETPEAEKSLRRDDVAAFVLGRRNDRAQGFTLGKLADLAADKKGFERTVTGTTVILHAQIGGLSKDGLLANDVGAAVPCADSENGWLPQRRDEPDKPDKEGPLVPFRVRRARVKKSEEDEAVEENSAPEEREDSTAEDERWRVVHAFDTERDDEGNAVVELVVEKWHEAETTENARAITRVEQGLAQHQEWAEDAAREIVGGLSMPEDIRGAITLAAKFHDEGKRAAVWQQAFNAPQKQDESGEPIIYAKTRGPFRNALNGYRHEFGSLLEIEGNNAIAAHPERDLILHLIAAHHGHARPVIATEGCDQAPPEALEERAREVALRFARLQTRFGPWGLAWLEALLRAADQQASRRLEDQERGDG